MGNKAAAAAAANFRSQEPIHWEVRTPIASLSGEKGHQPHQPPTQGFRQDVRVKPLRWQSLRRTVKQNPNAHKRPKLLATCPTTCQVRFFLASLEALHEAETIKSCIFGLRHQRHRVWLAVARICCIAMVCYWAERIHSPYTQDGVRQERHCSIVGSGILSVKQSLLHRPAPKQNV